jgi:hypothetical protein
MADEDSNKQVEIHDTNIAYSVDRGCKFKLKDGVDKPLQRSWLDITLRLSD